MTHWNLRLALALSLVVLSAARSAGQTSGDALDDLLIARRDAVHVELDDADAAAPRAIVMNRWIATVTLHASASADSEYARSVSAALADLDRQLADLGASRRSIVRLNALVTAPRSREETATLAERLADYLEQHEDADGRAALLGVFELVSDRRKDAQPAVALTATVLDPRTATEWHRTDPGWDYRPAATRAFVVGSYSARLEDSRRRRADRADVRLPRASVPQAQSRLDQLRRLLRKLRASPQDIHDMTIYYDPAAGIGEPELRAAADAFFPGGVPKADYVGPRIRYVPARSGAPPGAAVVIEASGYVTHDR